MADILKRNKALSVNPLKASQPIGGSLATLGFNRAMPMLHPAYLLRSPIGKRLAWRDMLAIKQALG